MSITYHRVVVAGGSIAGMLAAAALAPLAREVVVVDRDPLDEDAPRPGSAPRPGTPQALQSHGLLASGRLAIDELLPGFTDALLATGALSRGDMGSNGRWWIGGGLVTDSAVGAEGVAASRRLVETTVRQRTLALPNVELRDRTDVVGLLSDRRRTRVTGVALRAGTTGASRSELAADLVVDATGRSSRGSKWLTEHGWSEPPVERVRVGVRYATAHVERREGDLDGRYVIVSAATPASPQMGVAIAQEDGTWTISLGGYAEEQPPIDPDGFRQYAAGLVSPDISELIAGRDLLEPVTGYRFPDCRRRRIDQVRLPLGFAPVGDAIASFDPTFGQGMSVAALEAVLLGREAADGVESLRRRYPRAAMAAAERAWTVVVGADLQLPGVDGTPPPAHGLVSRYVSRAHRAAHRDPVVARALMRVTNLLDPPAALMRPAVLVRVARPHRAPRSAPQPPVVAVPR